MNMMPFQPREPKHNQKVGFLNGAFGLNYILDSCLKNVKIESHPPSLKSVFSARFILCTVSIMYIDKILN